MTFYRQLKHSAKLRNQGSDLSRETGKCVCRCACKVWASNYVLDKMKVKHCGRSYFLLFKKGRHTVRDAEHGNSSSAPRSSELPRDVRRLYHVSFNQKPPKNGVVVRYWVEGNHTKLLQRAAHCTKGVSKLQVSPKKRQRPGYMKIVFLSQNAEAVQKGTIFVFLAAVPALDLLYRQSCIQSHPDHTKPNQND